MHPLKKSNELMAHTYSHLYKIPTTGFASLLFMVQWDRPDMAYFGFTISILQGKPIKYLTMATLKMTLS